MLVYGLNVYLDCVSVLAEVIENRTDASLHISTKKTGEAFKRSFCFLTTIYTKLFFDVINAFYPMIKFFFPVAIIHICNGYSSRTLSPYKVPIA
ncbi:hypothetical protein DFO70_103482 [Cytobacillus firmus]|uniref:Uncharacterized protein n=2 Tax=Cytobacillus TaxID=2675230 RepID=A0A366K2Q7_CYTFI|nr:hypothetical protein DFO70_103482 [Cytobacillus firmus]TDX44279.1 hypothetical protein DFO72_104495 [Cytobacillus oceanisediminis]